MGSGQSSQPHTVTYENQSKAGPEIIITEEVRRRLGEGERRVESKEHRQNHPQNIGYSKNSADISSTQHTNEILAQNDQYWRKNMEDMEQLLQKTNAIMEQEFFTAYDTVRMTFSDPPAGNWIPPCGDLKRKLLKCYNANEGQSLHCFKEVIAFEKCVNANRIQQLDQKLKESN